MKYSLLMCLLLLLASCANQQVHHDSSTVNIQSDTGQIYLTSTVGETATPSPVSTVGETATPSPISTVGAIATSSPTISSSPLPLAIQNAMSNGWKVYVNVRYHYIIAFPNDWAPERESDSGDGRVIYTDKLANDVRIYAYYVVDDLTPQVNTERIGFHTSHIALNNGSTAVMVIGEEDGKTLCEVTWIPNDIVYHFYIKTSKKFFENNKQKLIDVIKSIDIATDAEEFVRYLKSQNKYVD